MFKELLLKLFGLSEDEFRQAPNEQAKAASDEQSAVKLYSGRTAGGKLVKKYIDKEVQRRAAFDRLVVRDTTVDAAPIPVVPADISFALVPEADKLPDAFKEIAQAHQKLLGLAQSVDSQTRLTIAENSATSEDILDLLASDSEADVRYAVAANPSCPQPTLQALGQDKNQYISYRVLQNLKHRRCAEPAAPSAADRPRTNREGDSDNRLGCSPNAQTLHWLILAAEDAGTDREVLEQLARHDHPDVRIAVSDNPMISLTLLGQLAHDENPDVRFAIAENHQMPVALLEALAADDNPYVAHRAQRTLQRICNSGILQNQFPFRGEAWWRTQRKASPG